MNTERVTRSPGFPVARRPHLFLILLILLLTTPLSAAITTSALTGRVTSGGSAVENATVTASSSALQHERVTITGKSGTYWLGALPPGDYEVTFSRTGMQSMTRRAVVELARVARADAQLEPSEDEESVTSTATTISVVHDTAVSTHRDAKALDRLPVPVDAATALYLAPRGYPISLLPEIDGTALHLFQQELVQGETAEEETYIRHGQPIEYARGNDQAIAVRTRSGGEQLSLAFRDTISNAKWLGDEFAYLRRGGVRQFFEAAAGGHVIAQRLWFFGAGWNGDRADGVPHDSRGWELKLTGQLGDRQNIVATYLDNDNTYEPRVNFGSSLLSAVHTAQWTPRFLSEVTAGHAYGGQEAPSFPVYALSEDNVSAKASLVAGDHVVSGGIETESGDLGDAHSLFVNDRIWLQRWTINAGVRYRDGDAGSGYNPASPGPRDDYRFSAQAAAAYDLRGRGRNAVTASLSRYALSYDRVDELTAGYVMALSATGSARFDIIHSRYGSGFKRTSYQLDSSYRLFDRFEAGLNYTYTDLDHTGGALIGLSANSANAWFSAEVPAGAHAVTATVAYRFASPPYINIFLENQHAFDLALRYTLPVKRVALTFAADAQNVLDRGPYADYPRVLRGWVRVRL
jgi:hypothetical protein